jgi:hypothetical protein
LRTDGNDTGVYRGITGGTYTEGRLRFGWHLYRP